jgi:aryl-alcohol dehydrogenase-like predicted oxidoreductase
VSDTTTRPARASGTFTIGGDVSVVRLGYGSMQIPGPGVWGEPRDHDEVIRVAHLDENVGAALIELTPDQIERLDAAI